MNHFKIFIDSSQWECSMNLIVCSKLYQYFIENGHTVVQDLKISDFIIVNSCGVSDWGKNRTLNIIQQYLNKKENHCSIIMFGCLADIDKQVTKGLNVIVIGFKDYQRLDALFYQKKRFEEIKPYCDDKTREKLLKKDYSNSVKLNINPIKIALMDRHQFFFSFPLLILSSRARNRYQTMMNRCVNTIFVQISEGCTGNCNYCSIKKAKGKVRSREIQDILDDIQTLYDPLKELYLSADDCGCYGTDKGVTLIQLLDAIHEKFPALSLKISYVDPSYFLKYSEEFLRIFQTMNITIIMIPLQSGSQTVLKKMNRNYDVIKVLDLIKKIKKISPSTLIFTHFIIGHPGETWGDYRKTIAAARFFDYPAPFEYSDNKGTVSEKRSDKVSRQVRYLRFILFCVYMNIVVFFRIVFFLRRNEDVKNSN
jgi:tRNA A37 methylthiotransferase MiaB